MLKIFILKPGKNGQTHSGYLYLFFDEITITTPTNVQNQSIILGKYALGGPRNNHEANARETVRKGLWSESPTREVEKTVTFTLMTPILSRKLALFTNNICYLEPTEVSEKHQWKPKLNTISSYICTNK